MECAGSQPSKGVNTDKWCPTFMPLCDGSIEHLLSFYFILCSQNTQKLCGSVWERILSLNVDVAFCFLAVQSSLPGHILLLLVVS